MLVGVLDNLLMVLSVMFYDFVIYYDLLCWCFVVNVVNLFDWCYVSGC